MGRGNQGQSLLLVLMLISSASLVLASSLQGWQHAGKNIKIGTSDQRLASIERQIDTLTLNSKTCHELVSGLFPQPGTDPALHVNGKLIQAGSVFEGFTVRDVTTQDSQGAITFLRIRLSENQTGALREIEFPLQWESHSDGTFQSCRFADSTDYADSMDCPAGTVLTEVDSSGRPHCMQIPREALSTLQECPMGHYATGIDGGTLTCKPLPQATPNPSPSPSPSNGGDTCSPRKAYPLVIETGAGAYRTFSFSRAYSEYDPRVTSYSTGSTQPATTLNGVLPTIAGITKYGVDLSPGSDEYLHARRTLGIDQSANWEVHNGPNISLYDEHGNITQWIAGGSAIALYISKTPLDLQGCR